MIKCDKCNIVFDNHNKYANHIRHVHKQTGISKSVCQFCNKEVATYNHFQHEQKCILNPLNERFCLSCDKELTKINTKFCNNKCSAQYNNKHRKRNRWSAEQRDRFSQIKQGCCSKGGRPQGSLTGYNRCKLYQCVCIVCNTGFVHKSKRKTCSDVCYRKHLQNKARSNINCGGSVGYRRYYYKNTIFDSSWEVDIAKFLDDKNILWERSRKKHILWWSDKNGNRRRYYPDFYLPNYNLYLDPKNTYKIKQDKDKIDYIKQYHNLEVGSVQHLKNKIIDLLINI